MESAYHADVMNNAYIVTDNARKLIDRISDVNFMMDEVHAHNGELFYAWFHVFVDNGNVVIETKEEYEERKGEL